MTLADMIRPHLAYLRRYARALTGSQHSGDSFVRTTLEAVVADPDIYPDEIEPRVALYKIFHKIWASANVETADMANPDSAMEQGARERLDNITPISRQILLLTALEGFSVSQLAEIANVGEESINGLLEEAVVELDREMRTNVLIIEDEALISMELEQIVTDLGHKVTDTVTTHGDAIESVKDQRPGMILADIQLADGSSGIDTVKEILDQFEVPVIFITAFPERLLTGDRPEPTFLITKPFQPNAIRAAISQALFFKLQAHPA